MFAAAFMQVYVLKILPHPRTKEHDSGEAAVPDARHEDIASVPGSGIRTVGQWIPALSEPMLVGALPMFNGLPIIKSIPLDAPP